MVSLDEAVIARIKKHGHTFEIFVDPDLALAFKSGDEVDLAEVLAAENIFKDAKAGDKAAAETLTEAFSSTDVNTVASEIIRKGELHLTTEQRKRILEDRRKQIVDIIARNALNPQTKTPHPPSRIDKAMDEAKVKVDFEKSAKAQVDEVLKALKPIIPIKFETVEVALKIPAKYSGSIYQTLHDFGDLKKEEWRGDEQYCVLHIPGGMQDELFKVMNELTHGEVEIKLLK
ncbi:MAG: ribosome assembly factor SBDS [Methanobacteriota archaeon]